MIFRILASCLLTLLVQTTSAEANERLPDWISISPKLSSSVTETRGNVFPSEEDRAAWERGGFGFVDLLWRINIHIERSGMIESRVEVVRHFLSEAGISQGGNMDLYADTWRDQLTIETGYSISPNAPPIFVDPDTVEIVSDDTENVFSDVQRVIIPVPGLQIGSNAIVTGTRRFQSADFPLNWSRIITLGSIVPIARIEVTVSSAEGAPELIWDSNDPDLECEELGDRSLSCIRSNVPAVQLDPNVLSYTDLIPHLYVGAAETWSGLQSKVSAFVEESAALTPSL